MSGSSSETEIPIVSVIIVNWNGRNWLEQCLPALAEQTFTDFEVIVVDNGSEDDSVKYLGESWPDIRVLARSENTGFAAPNNWGIEEARGEWIATLNNDTLVHRSWLKNLLAETGDPQVGMVASLVVFWDEPDRVDAAGILVDAAGIAWNRGHGQLVDDVSVPCEVFGPNGSAALYRREMLDNIGLFDEDYFAYYEDVDLAWRARRAGWRCRYTPAAIVRHRHSATGGQFPWLKTFLISRNKLWTIVKNYDRSEFVRRMPIILFYDLASLFYRLVLERNLAPLKGRLAALRGFAKMKSKRTGGEAITLSKPRNLRPKSSDRNQIRT
jgi:GT2 family glycosyltransferase